VRQLKRVHLAEKLEKPIIGLPPIGLTLVFVVDAAKIFIFEQN